MTTEERNLFYHLKHVLHFTYLAVQEINNDPNPQAREIEKEHLLGMYWDAFDELEAMLTPYLRARLYTDTDIYNFIMSLTFYTRGFPGANWERQ